MPHRFIVSETDLETGAQSITDIFECDDARTGWQMAYSNARFMKKPWRIKHGTNMENWFTQHEINNDNPLPVGNQMRIKHYTRELQKLDQQLQVLRQTRKELATEIAELGGPEYF